MASNKKLKVISLGGLQEVGKNMTAFEYGKDIIIVDCGVAFPDESLLGIDLIIPDFTYILKNKDNIRGIFLTHGHEDHIGGVPYLLRNINVPIYGTKLTCGLLNNKIKEHNLKATMNVVEAGKTINCGCFRIEFIHVNHSIADACALAINTPVGMVVHSGDFKIDHTPMQGEVIDLQRFAELGREGVKLFLCESTNAENKGFTMSERNVGDIMEDIFRNSRKQRIMVATFSSNIHRIQQIISCAKKQKRKICILGRSMVNAIKTSSELGYIDIDDSMVIEPGQISNYPPEKVVIISTGSQGEPMAALSRIASGEHKFVQIRPNDKIVISASPIPGNEKTVSRVINGLLKKGAEVIYHGIMDIHVSGHAKQEEIKILHSLIKPEYVMPVHGEYRHLKSHKDMLIDMGMNKNNIFVMDIGDVLEVGRKETKLNGTVPSGRTLIDGLGVGDIGNVVLRDRKQLSEDGLVMVVLTVDKGAREIVSGPDIISRGFVYVRESDGLIREAKSVVDDAIYGVDLHDMKDWNALKNTVRSSLREFFWQKTKRNPMILPIVMEM